MSYESQNDDQLMAELEGEFADLIGDSGDGSTLSAEFQELEAELFDVPELADFDVMGFSALASDDPVEAQADMLFLGGFLKGKVSKLIKKLLKIIKSKGAKAANCAKKLAEAIKAFKAKQYVKALRLAYQVFLCLKKL